MNSKDAKEHPGGMMGYLEDQQKIPRYIPRSHAPDKAVPDPRMIGWVNAEYVADGFPSYRFLFFVGPAWHDARRNKHLFLPRPFNTIYYCLRKTFEYLYWPLRLEKTHALRYNILRRCIMGICQDPNTGELEDKQYTMEAMKQICREMQGCTYKGLQDLHRKWVGY